MLKPIRASIVILLLMTVLTGLAYPLAMVGAAGAIFPDQAAGSLVVRDGKVVGCEPDRPGLRRRIATSMAGRRPPATSRYDCRQLLAARTSARPRRR